MVCLQFTGTGSRKQGARSRKLGTIRRSSLAAPATSSLLLAVHVLRVDDLILFAGASAGGRGARPRTRGLRSLRRVAVHRFGEFVRRLLELLAGPVHVVGPTRLQRLACVGQGGFVARNVS